MRQNETVRNGYDSVQGSLSGARHAAPDVCFHRYQEPVDTLSAKGRYKRTTAFN